MVVSLGIFSWYLLSALCLSKRPLKQFTIVCSVAAVTTSSGKLFHSSVSDGQAEKQTDTATPDFLTIAHPRVLHVRPTIKKYYCHFAQFAQ